MYLANPPTSVLTHSSFSIAFMVLSTRVSCTSSMPIENMAYIELSSMGSYSNSTVCLTFVFCLFCSSQSGAICLNFSAGSICGVMPAMTSAMCLDVCFWSLGVILL